MRTISSVVTLVLIGCAPALAQTPSAEVKKFFKFDAPVVALTHVRVIDGTGHAAQENRTIVLRDGRIESVSEAAKRPPADARIVDLKGRSVIPGLVGMHDHLMYTASLNVDDDGEMPPPGFIVTELAFSAPRLYLAAGVTTIRTTGSIEPYTDLNLRRMIESLEMPGPRIDVSGPYLDGKGDEFPQMVVLADAEHARRTVAFWAGEGVTSFKAYMMITEEELAAAVQESHRRGLKITGHLCSVDYRQAAALGIDDLEHGPVFTDSEFVPDRKHDTCPSGRAIRASWDKLEIGSPQVQALLHDLIDRHVAVTSTLPVFESFIATRPLPAPRQSAMMSSESLRSFLAARASAATNPARSLSDEAEFKKEMAFELAFARAGGLLLAGPDPTGIGGVLAGFGDQRELELLVEAGFTPLEAIHIGTANGAQYLGKLDRIGTVEAGKRADLVVINGDPSRRIEDVENVEIVFRDGLAYDPAKLMNSVRGMVGTR